MCTAITEDEKKSFVVFIGKQEKLLLAQDVLFAWQSFIKMLTLNTWAA